MVTSMPFEPDPDEQLIEVIRHVEFQVDQRVMTPDGPGKIDGYASPPGTSVPKYEHVWVWLDRKINGSHLRPYATDQLVPL